MTNELLVCQRKRAIRNEGEIIARNTEKIIEKCKVWTYCRVDYSIKAIF